MAPFTPAPARRYRVIGISPGHGAAEISFAESLARDRPKAAEITHHIAMVTKLARVSVCNRHVLEARFEGFAEEPTAQ